jgi:purine nucleosidase/pyrimidine-specific ribonucleoside hydrolase
VIPLLIDTDPGIDDALALLLAWGSEDAAVEVVTTVAGNTPLDRGTVNVFRLLALRRPRILPRVAAGAAKPLGRSLITAGRYHGEDGLGDLTNWPPIEVRPAPEPASVAIVEAARRHREKLCLVALGPLTNVALAVESDREAMAGLGRLVAMGGAVDVPGNVTPSAEFNMHVDPEAAARVLAAGLVLDLVPLDATHQATLERQALEATLARAAGPAADRILAFTRRAFRIDGGTMYLHDPLAVAVALDPTLVTWEPLRLEIASDGATRRASGPPNCRVARRVDRARLVALVLERLCPASW